MFRLAKVLRFKERLEKEALAHRARAEARLRELEDAATSCRVERSRLPDDAEATLESLVAWASYADGLRERERRVRERLEGFRPEVAEAVHAHVEAKREVEGLRRLRERTLLRQRRKRERAQQELLDDVASRPFVPGGGSNCRSTPDEADTWPAPETAEATMEGKLSTKREKEA